MCCRVRSIRQVLAAPYHCYNSSVTHRQYISNLFCRNSRAQPSKPFPFSLPSRTCKHRSSPFNSSNPASGSTVAWARKLLGFPAVKTLGLTLFREPGNGALAPGSGSTLLVWSNHLARWGLSSLRVQNPRLRGRPGLMSRSTGLGGRSQPRITDPLQPIV